MAVLERDMGMSAGGYVGQPDSYHVRINKEDGSVEMATFNAAGEQSGHIHLSRAVGLGFATYIVEVLRNGPDEVLRKEPTDGQ
jgi:hypothetical protein